MLAVRRLTRYTFLKRTHPVLSARRAYRFFPLSSTCSRRPIQIQLRSKMTAHINHKQHNGDQDDHPFRRTDSAVSIMHLKREPFKVTVIGSGNWGTTIAKVIAENTALHSHIFNPEVRMWVFDEKIGDENLTDIINTRHQNVKYLPKIDLPHNLVADPDLLHRSRVPISLFSTFLINSYQI